MSPEAGKPFGTVMSVWRAILEIVWRLPLLVLGTALLYMFLYFYWVRDLSLNLPHGWGQVPYGPLHAVIFAPLVFAVLLMVVRGDIDYADVWKAGAIPVACVVIAYEWSILALNRLAGVIRPRLFDLLYHEVAGQILYIRLVALLGLMVLVVKFLLSVRLALLLPLVATERESWRTLLTRAWHDMRGHYGFALVVSLAAFLPVTIADYFLLRLYRRLDVHTGPHLELWGGFFVWSVHLTLVYIATAALAAWLDRAIKARRATVFPRGITTGMEAADAGGRRGS